jgi:hypothetical protein
LSCLFRLPNRQKTQLSSSRGEGEHGIDPGGPTRGDVEREECRQQGEERWFDSNDAEESAGNGAGQKQRCAKAEDQADESRLHGRYYKAKNIESASAERDADTDFVLRL